ncbi:MAG: LuxR family transcriptional regulator [Magnetospirillum sp. WYHS-4]
MLIESFIEETNRSGTPEEVFSLYERALGDLGFDRVMYSALADHPAYDSVGSPAVMRNYPDDWVKYYVAKNYIELDPVRTYCLGTNRPFTWQDMMGRTKLSRGQRAVMDEGLEAGLRDGLAVPLHGPYGEVMGVGMASSFGGTEPERRLGFIHALTVQFHSAYTALALPMLSDAPTVRLTAREIEILKWAAAGKSNGVIADILGISEHGVDFHMRNILAKLKADSRLTAVVKGYRLRLISI